MRCSSHDEIAACLTSGIPKSVSDLTALTYLDLDSNSDITSLPYFGTMKKLECVHCR